MCIPSTSSLLIDAFSTWTLTEHPISAAFLSTTPPFADKSWNCLWPIRIVPLRRLEAWIFRILCKLLMGKWRARPMLLRDHPLMSYKGMPSWPPAWTWTGGVENDHPRGEVGVLEAILPSVIQPADRF